MLKILQNGIAKKGQMNFKLIFLMQLTHYFCFFFFFCYTNLKHFFFISITLNNEIAVNRRYGFGNISVE